MDAPEISETNVEPAVNTADAEALTLVILAAGAGRRYGGLKQLEPVGSGEATLIDYTAFDAHRAGFGRIVLVIRPETEPDFRSHFDSRFGSHLELSYAAQRLDGVPAGCKTPAGRTRPWGTGHAVLAAEGRVEGPFAVANADDFYGDGALRTVRQFLSNADVGDVPTYAVVGYALAGTLSDTGGVSRAVCDCGPDNDLRDIVETDGIERHGRHGRYTDAKGISHIVDGETLVSMNLWAFRPTIFKHLRSRFKQHLSLQNEVDGSEFRLPTAIRGLVEERTARVRVLRSDSVWCGLTHRRDKAHVVEQIQSLTETGHYPPKLWG